MNQGKGRRLVGYLAKVATATTSLFVLSGCPSAPGPDVPMRACGLTVWYRPASDANSVSVVGSWDGWTIPGAALPVTRSDGWRVTRLDLPPGEYSYAIIDDAIMLADPNVPTLAMHQGQEVSWVDVPDCSVPELQVTAAEGSIPASAIDSGAGAPQGTATVALSFLAGSGGAAIDPGTVAMTERDGTVVPASAIETEPSTGSIVVALTGLAYGKHTYTVTAKDTGGKPAEPAVATVWAEPTPFDLRDTTIYQVVVDRFRNADGFLATPELPSARAGGTIDGVTAAIESGYFTGLGFNTLWISPLYAGPQGTFLGADGRPYTDYHGYWPAAARELEASQTDEASLNAMMASAHAHGIRVLFDVVPNHVHIDNPYWANRTDNSWFNRPDGTCICGAPDCPWSTDIIDCWFTPYLADLAWQNPAAADQLTSDVRWWLDTYDGDGVRIDAVPMMWRLASRRIANAIRTTYDNPGHQSFILGENFVGEGDFVDLQYELGPQGLDSEFHFPLLWALQNQVAGNTGAMSEIDSVIQSGEAAWGGSGAVMSLIIGNQDVPRFSSVSAGNAYGDTWTPAPQSGDPVVYAKQQMALSIVFALPGAPTVFYGDEVALAGGGDPDCRRVMPDDSELTSLQQATRETVRRLGAVRRCSVALRRGTYRTLHAGPEDLVFAREAPSADTVVVVALRQPAAPLSIPLPGIAPGSYLDLMSGAPVTISPAGLENFTSSAFSVALLVPAGSSCAAIAPAAP